MQDVTRWKVPGTSLYVFFATSCESIIRSLGFHLNRTSISILSHPHTMFLASWISPSVFCVSPALLPTIWHPGQPNKSQKLVFFSLQPLTEQISLNNSCPPGTASPNAEHDGTTHTHSLLHAGTTKEWSHGSNFQEPAGIPRVLVRRYTDEPTFLQDCLLAVEPTTCMPRFPVYDRHSQVLVSLNHGSFMLHKESGHGRAAKSLGKLCKAH